MRYFGFIVLTCLLWSSCNLDTSDDTANARLVDIGTYTILPSTLASFVYAGRDEVVFVDSLGNRRVLFLGEEDIKNKLGIAIVKDDPTNPDKKVNYQFDTQFKRYILKNDSFFIRFNLELEARPWADNPESRLVADFMNIYYPNALGSPELVGFAEVDQRTWPRSVMPIPLDTLSIFGFDYYNVYQYTTIEKPPTTMEYSKELGIVSFVDWTGVKWRLLY